jgi:transposase
VGIDRGVATTIATSDGELLHRPIMRSSERRRLARLQASLARQGKGSRRSSQTKLCIAGLHRRVALPVRNMVRRPKPRPDPDNPGHFLPNGEAAKAGLNRSIHANCWGMIARRLAHKMTASGTTLVVVSAQCSSQQCRECGHTSPETVRAKRSCGVKPAVTLITPTATRKKKYPGPGQPACAHPRTGGDTGFRRCARASENRGRRLRWRRVEIRRFQVWEEVNVD